MRPRIYKTAEMKEAEAREAAKPLEQRKTEALQKVIDTCERAKNVSDLIYRNQRQEAADF